MSSVSVWILSVAIVVIVGVIFDLIIPEGQTSKYIRGAISLVIVLVIVLPLPKLFGGNFDLNKYINTDIEIDEGLMFALNKEKVENLEKELEKILKDNGFSGVEISVSANYYSLELKLNAIFVDLSKLVLNDESLNINKYQVITDLILNNVVIEEDDILIYG